MTERNLHDMTDDDLLQLLADLERVQEQAEELLLARMEERRLPTCRQKTGAAAYIVPTR